MARMQTERGILRGSHRRPSREIISLGSRTSSFESDGSGASDTEDRSQPSSSTWPSNQPTSCEMDISERMALSRTARPRVSGIRSETTLVMGTCLSPTHSGFDAIASVFLWLQSKMENSRFILRFAFPPIPICLSNHSARLRRPSRSWGGVRLLRMAARTPFNCCWRSSLRLAIAF